ncbi:hypothetical protein PhCBS80983_g01177 [Powellomyces hirtus]|uniref:Uncharacterized protein n=1 Tax=Powellomyces hirtus TaxID=109895 RepID=A0A507EBV4_9FUNG|nr:hypothetical protein PhCBS80983_g01177 [Powellomyces hirtus]
MSGSQQPSNPNGVYIPPRRNVPARRGTNRSNPVATTYAAVNPPPGELNRASTLGGPHIAPRTSSGATVSIPSRGASAQAFPDRAGSAGGAPLSGRMSFVPPPRRTAPGAGLQQPQQPQPPYGQQQTYQQPSQYTSYPPVQMLQQQYQPHMYSRPTTVAMPTPSQYGAYQTPAPYEPYQQPYPASSATVDPLQLQPLSTYPPLPSSLAPTEGPYLTPTQAFPEPQYSLFNSGVGSESDFNRRPSSLYVESDAPPPHRVMHKHSMSETSISSLDELDTSQPRLSRQGSDSSQSNGPFIPPRSGGFMIPLRNTSVQKPNIDTLLDEGAMAYAAPRHNVDEALAKWRQARELAVKEKDLLREAKALSNMGCALRNLGHLQEGLSDLRESWDLSTRYVEEAAWKSNSLWLQLVMRHADIDSDVEPDDGVVSSSGAGGFGNRSTITSSSTSRSESTQDASQGPPIVCWFLQLTTNLGNAYYCLGQYQEAIQYHDMCKRLAEAVLEEYPLPAQFTLGNLQRNASTASLSKAAGTASEASGEGGDSSNHRNSADAGPSTKTKIKLSYLHRQTLLAESRSLTHLGLCHQQLGLDDEALATHKQAESIVTFYSARLLLATTSTRKASLSNPQDISTEVSAAEAATVANLGTSYYAKGRVPLAMEYHKRAAKLFGNIGDSVGKAKEEANVGCLSIEVGKVVNLLQWSREMEHPPADSHTAGDVMGDGSVSNLDMHYQNLGHEIDLEGCRKYWGPPRLETVNWGTGAPDEHAPEILGQPLFDEGILSLYEVEKVFRETDDWIGLDFVFANLGYVLLHQPYLALYYLSRLVHEPIEELGGGTAPPSQLYATATDLAHRSRGGIPTFLFPHVYFTLTQALFVLTRLQQEQPDRPLFPPAGTEESLDHGTGIPVMAADPVSRLFQAMDLQNLTPDTVNDESLTEVIEGCRATLEGILKLRTQTVETAMYGVAANTTCGATGTGPPSCLDVVRQKSAIAHATSGKIAWLLAGSARTTADVPDAFRRLYFEEAQGAFRKFALDVIGGAAASAASSSSFILPSAPGDSAPSPNLQPLGLPFLSSETNTVLPGAGGASHTTTDPDHPASSPDPPSGVVGLVFTAAHKLLQSRDTPKRNSDSTFALKRTSHHASPLLAPLFALTADLTAFALYQHTQNSHLSASGLDLVALLGIPATGRPITRIRDTLLAGATRLYANAIGVCEPCALDFVKDLEPLDGEDVTDIVFRTMQEAAALKRSSATSTSGTGRPQAVGVFPCPHYVWDEA